MDTSTENAVAISSLMPPPPSKNCRKRQKRDADEDDGGNADDDENVDAGIVHDEWMMRKEGRKKESISSSKTRS
jgi:hypothetical protein